MSRLSELIAGLCPDGVEYKTLGSFAECFSGATPRKKNSEYWENGTIPWMSSGEVHQHVVRHVEGRITQLGYDSCSTRMVPAGTVLVALAGQGKTRGTVAITEIELCTNQSIGAILCSEMVESKYLYYYLSGQYDYLRRVSSGEGTRGGLNMPLLRGLNIPVPPIEVQREIVRILDSFQELNDVLTAEIEAREKQIEYLIEKCFNRFANDDRVASLPLQSVCKVLKAGGDAPSDCVKGMTSPDALHPYPVFSNGTGDSALYGYAGSYVIADDAVTIAARGSIGYHTVRSGMFTPVIRLITLVPNELVMLDYLDAALSGCKLGGTVGSISQLTVPMVRNERIPVPSLDAQRTFIREVNAIRQYKEHLVRERNARRSQFTYYRDKLLTFPRKVS